MKNFPRYGKPGTYNPADFNRLIAEVERESRLSVSPPLELDQGFGGPSIRFNVPWRVGEIVSVAGTGYRWRELVPSGSGEWQAANPDGSGPLPIAYEVEGRSTPAGAIVRLWVGAADEWVFEYGSTDTDTARTRVINGVRYLLNDAGVVIGVENVQSTPCGTITNCFKFIEDVTYTNGCLYKTVKYAHWSPNGFYICDDPCSSGSGSGSSGSGSGSGGGGGGGGTVTGVSCCPDGVPTVLYVTVVDQGGNCSALAGSHQLTWNQINQIWTTGSVSCSGHTYEIYLQCVFNYFSVFLLWDGLLEDRSDALFYICDPFELSGTWDLSSMTPCCSSAGGTLTFTITE